jgi:hypothetical protein
MRHVPIALYIDTEVFVRNGLRFDTSDFRALRDTFVKGGLRLLVPKMMERELVRHFRRRARDVAERVSNAHNEHPIRTLSLPLPSKPDLEEQCFKALQKEWEEFKGHFTIEDLPLIGKLEDIVDWYFAIEAPFSSPKKEKEFPDAFILSALEAYFQLHSVRIAVVSSDGDFSSACTSRKNISHFARLKDYIDAFAPELTKEIYREPIDPTKPITTEDLTEMKAILGRGSEITSIERDRVLNLISTRGTNYEYFFRNANEAFWLKSLNSGGFFLNPPPVERGEGGTKVPRWWPMEYLVRVFEKSPAEVIAIIDSLPEVENPRILESIIEIILNSNDPDLIKKFYRKIEGYLDSRL